MKRSPIDLEAGWFLEEPGTAAPERNVHLSVTREGGRIKGKGTGNDLIMPAPVNAHDHGYGVRTLDFDCQDDALEPWIAGLRQRPRTDPYLEALVSFARLAKNGVGATMHCHNSLRLDDLAQEVTAVVRAAKDVGIRLAVSCPLLNHDPWVYGGPEGLKPYVPPGTWQNLAEKIPVYASIADQLAMADAIADDQSSDLVDIQYGPIGPQWCTDEMLESIAERYEATGRRIHMHLLESPRQRLWLDRRFEEGVVRYLDTIGFLSPRLAVAHGVHLRPDECELLAERGVTVVSNPAANLRLRSGIAPVPLFEEKGLRFAFGLDGTGFDDDQDLWRELRLAWLLHGGQGLGQSLSAGSLYQAAIIEGARVVNQPAHRDFVQIAYGEVLEDAIFDDGDVAQTLLTRMSGRFVSGLIVDGSWVVKQGHLVRIDFDTARKELHAQAKADLPRLQSERKIAHILATAIRSFYTDWN